MASVHIRLLGTFQIRYGGAPVTAIYQPRQQSLLAYLILRCSTAQVRNPAGRSPTPYGPTPPRSRPSQTSAGSSTICDRPCPRLSR